LSIEVETRYGRLRGSAKAGIKVFRGIPYARPPLGTDRFHGPRPPEPWTGVRKATRAGAVPVQASVPRLSYLNAGGARQSEKCLYLNVWTPALDTAKRPVLVWIHGGGFLIGSGSTPIYDGYGLAERGDLVVVTFNYRLGALGYLHLNGLGGDDMIGASNAGVRDQIAALEWVRDNIDRFGGDPNNVTVAGQSAGAMSIGALLGAPSARRLFKRAILQSGATEHVMDQDEANESAEVFLRELGGPPVTRQSLANIPVEALLQAQGSTNQALTSLARLMAFLPCIDGEVITENPLDVIERGDASDISLLVGTNLDEWKLFSPFESGLPTLEEDEMRERFEDLLPQISEHPPSANEVIDLYREAVISRGGDPGAFEVWNAFQSARVFHRPASVLAERQRQAGGSAFAYLFTWRPPAMRRVLGACHAMELPFVFGFTGHPAALAFTGMSPAASRLSRRIQQAWIQFVRSGDPSHDRLPGWPGYDDAKRATMVLGRRCYIDHAPLEAERQLIESWC
jgi:para-nitrobenzyl esterase